MGLDELLDKAFGKKPTGETDSVIARKPIQLDRSKLKVDSADLKPLSKIEKTSAQYQKKKATRGSIRGIKTFLELPEDHTRGATIYTETQDIVNYLIKCIKEKYWD